MNPQITDPASQLAAVRHAESNKLPSADAVYAGLLSDVYQNGERRSDRTGTGTISLFGGSAKFDCENTVPLLTRKRVAVRSCVAELVWFLIGSKDANLLNKLKSTI